LPETDLDLLIAAARESGDIAKTYFGNRPQVWDKADNAGPVTAADLAVNEMLERELQRARPAYGWLSEETEDHSARLDTDSLFVVDPIDGTRAFIEGSHDWAHSIAVVKDGIVKAGVVYVPMRDLMFTATLGGGAFLNGEKLQTSATAELADATVLSSKVNFEGRFWRDGKTPLAKRHFRSSLAYRLSLVAQARFDAMLTLRPTWEWDIAAGALMVAEAGGTVTTHCGGPLKFNNPVPNVAGVVAAGPVHADLVAGIAPLAPSA